MTYPISSGISISIDNINWYSLTDHNREPIQVTNQLIEQSNRMANGQMRKYVIANKRTFSTSWKDLSSNPLNVVDYGKQQYPVVSSSWLAAFYAANVAIPVYIKFTHSTETVPTIGNVPSDLTYSSSTTGVETIKCYITKFSVTTKKRMKAWDYVDMDIEFQEI